MSLLKNAQKKAQVVNAREMIIFSLPKVGKTSLMTKLPGEYLILDFEGGTDYFNCNAININNVEIFLQLQKELVAEKPMYDFIVIDTLTSLYDNVGNALAVMSYNKEEGKNKPLNFDITTLSYGLGYTYKRNTIQKLISFLKNYCKTLIILGHVADKSMGDTSANLNIKDLAIEGKLKDILALKTDAMGLLYRADIGVNKLSFNPSTGLIGGTRIPHLSNQEFIISELDENGNLITHWDKIFI